MSKTMCAIEEKIEKISKETGYEFDYLIDRFNELIEDDREIDEAIDEVSTIASEQDY